jgi:hypothetical protein
VTRGLVGRYVETYAYADGRLDVRWKGHSLAVAPGGKLRGRWFNNAARLMQATQQFLVVPDVRTP